VRATVEGQIQLLARERACRLRMRVVSSGHRGGRGQAVNRDEKLDILRRYLSPENPIRTTEFLRGRTKELESLVQELRHFHAIPFIYGNRGSAKPHWRAP
jgi:hypothetical protein